MESFAFLKRTGDARDVPCIVTRTETQRCVLGARDPSVVRQTTVGVGAVISVDQLPRRLHANLGIDTVEREVLFVFDKVKNVRV